MPSQTLLDDLVTANHILYHEGVLDAYGHVSARDDENPRQFLLARHMAPGIVTHDDIVTFDLEGKALNANGRKLYSELWIHAAAYAARPDVGGVVHSHSHAVIPYSVTGVELRPVCHVGSFLGEGVALFDTQDVAGDTDLLIRNMELGRALAKKQGDAPVALMRGHGSVATGASLREAVFRAYYTEVNAKLQMDAMRMGKPITFLTAGEVKLRGTDRDPTYRRPWEFWKAQTEE
ncbi:MAG TPA: class II aldolase/adducin family protein [Candidatus Binatia bacterium]|nr:class II aldolase/adducin family protein [Candidatus Binatia bacterium]